jgi:hypothetical protein
MKTTVIIITILHGWEARDLSVCFLGGLSVFGGLRELYLDCRESGSFVSIWGIGFQRVAS